MKRLYYLTDNIDSTQSISEDLHKAGITDWNFHVISKQNESGLYRRHIHSANIIHKSDLIHSAERGAIFGLMVGVLVSIIVSASNFFGGSIGTTGFIFITLFFVLFGGWFGGFIGIQTENYKIKRFHDALENGAFLIMVDIEVGTESQVKEIMKHKHPEATLCANDTSMITPFDNPEAHGH
ncbi:hypothetical protein ACUR5C_10060 [Aliikangiella sp. IMCC44653]